MSKRRRTWWAICMLLVVLSLGFLVLGLVPTGLSGQLSKHLWVGARMTGISWDAPPDPPPPGMWAGQVNRFGVRYNRTSDGAEYVGFALWIFAIPAGALAVLIARRLQPPRTGLPVVSLVALSIVPLLLVLLCIQSLLEHDQISTANKQHPWSMRFQDGRIVVAWVSWHEPSTVNYVVSWDNDVFFSFDIPNQVFASAPTLPGPSIANLYGFAAGSTRNTTFTVDAIALPYWPLILLGIMPPALLLGRHLRLKRRLNLNLCAGCGYDLRETPQCCPECGAPAAGLGEHATASSAAT